MASTWGSPLGENNINRRVSRMCDFLLEDRMVGSASRRPFLLCFSFVILRVTLFNIKIKNNFVAMAISLNSSLERKIRVSFEVCRF